MLYLRGSRFLLVEGVEMSIRTAIRHSVGLVEKTARPGSTIGAISIPTGATVSHLSKWSDLPQAYRVHPWLHAAVKAIATAVAHVPIVALKLKRTPRYTMAEFKRLERIERWEDVVAAYKEAEGAEEDPTYWALDVLRNPLPEANLTQHDLLQAIVSYLELAGNSYVEKLFSDQGKSRVVGLWPKIDPRNMYVVPGEERLIAGYVFRSGATTKLFSADEIIHFAYFHAENQYYGLSPVEVLKASLAADVRAMDWNQMFFDNSAIPSGIFSTEARLSPEDVRLWRELWDEQHGGVRRAHRTAIMGQGMKYQPLGYTHRAMGFLDLLQYSRDQILGVYGVPPIVLGIYEDANRASASVMRQLFYEQTVIPRLGKIEATLNFALVKPGENVRLVFDVGAIEALREDMAQKVEVGKGLKELGWTLNELREFTHQKRAEGSLVDSLLVPLNVQEAGRVAAAKTGGKAKRKELSGDDYLPPVDRSSQEEVHRKFLPELFIAGGLVGIAALTRLGVEVPIDWMDDFGFAATAQAWTQERVIPLAGGIDDITRARISAIIDEGMEQGLASADIAKNIRNEFDSMSRVRAVTIARTETHGAVGAGQHEVYRKMEIGKHEWITTTDGREREWHGAADGQVQPLNRPFIVNGERLMYPGDSGGSASNVINCRCAESPVVGKEFDRVRFWKEWDKALSRVEKDTGERYRKALSKWFKAEGERYVEHFGGIA